MAIPRKTHALPPVPAYLASLRKVRLGAHDWRRLVVFLLRRLDRKHPKLSEEFAWDIQTFTAIRQKYIKPGADFYVHPRILLGWLREDASIGVIAHQVDYLESCYRHWQKCLGALPRKRWPTFREWSTFGFGPTWPDADRKHWLREELNWASTSRQSIPQVAYALTAICFKLADADTVRVQIARRRATLKNQGQLARDGRLTGRPVVFPPLLPPWIRL